MAVIICMMTATSNSAMAQQGTNTLSAGQKLTEGQRLISANKVYYLAMQADGNLCLKKANGDEFVWCSMADLGSGHYLTLQSDGNLVVYNKDNKPVWNSMTQAFYDTKFGTADSKPVRAVLEDNGTLNLYSATNKKVWDNNFKGEQPTVPPTEGFVGSSVKKQMKVLLPHSKTPKNAVVEVTNTGQVFYDGDINLGTLEKVTQEAAAPSVHDPKWPNSTIPYKLSASHPRYEVIKKGIEEMNKKTNICLVPHTNQKDYVEFVSKGGNWSALGRVGGRQEISIENKVVGTVCHELMHALGFYHTQSREDRDNYVTINISNVQKGFESNFQKESDEASNLGVYDYGSCMHYHAKSFAKDNKINTISLKNAKGGEDKIMGQRDSMSHMDIINISDVYSACSNKGNKKPYVTKETANIPSTKVASNNNTGTQPTTIAASSACDAKNAEKKYQTSMKPGERLAEKEKLVSANGRYHFRVTTDGNFVIEEVLNSGTCPFQEIYRFPINNGGSKPAVSFFSYNPDGNICMDSKQGKTYCATTGQDANAAAILQKSIKLELTDDGRLRLVNKGGQEIWATPFASKTNAATKPTAQPTTQSNTTEVAPDKFIKTKPILNNGENLNMGQTLTSENNQYQCRLIKQKVDIGGGRTQEQNRFIIDKITVKNGMITNRVEIWNKECKEGTILGQDQKIGASIRFQDCFYDSPLSANAIVVRNGVERHFGQIKLENDGSLNIIYNGYYKAKLCPVREGEMNKNELHYRTASELYAGRVESSLGRLEIGQTLTSDNNQYQCRISPEKRFVIERIIVGKKENGEKYVANREVIWDKECKEGFIEVKQNSLQPNCFKKEVPVVDNTKPQRIPQGQKAHRWKLENDGTIKWYADPLDKTGFVTCNPYQ